MREFIKGITFWSILVGIIILIKIIVNVLTNIITMEMIMSGIYVLIILSVFYIIKEMK